MKSAFIFPGQGSQFSGMGKELYQGSAKAREMMEAANEILGFRITDIMFEGSDEELKATRVTQPAIFLHSVVLAGCSNLPTPDMTGGHSLGEFSALVAAGAVSFEDALRIVAARASAMQRCCEQVPGSMAAVIALDEATVEKVCSDLRIPTKSNRVDIGVRVEIPAVIFSHITDELYESKIVYRTEKFEDNVRTFCMNPRGIVVNENTNGIITVNGHSFEDEERKTENTNFALLVSKHFSEPFKDSNGYGESIARLSNMLGGGVIVQRFGDLERGRRSTRKRIEEGTVHPTLNATPGDLSLVLPKRILDGIIEMIYALDRIAPGTANDDTLLYGVEVKFYNMEVEVDRNLETLHKGLYMIGDGSGVTHSLSHASASGVYVARRIAEREA